MSKANANQARSKATTGSYSITVRLHTGTDPAVIGQLATAVSEAGGITTALDIVESRHDRLVVDLTCSAVDGEHAEQLVDALKEVSGVSVHKVSDRTFLLHIGGKIGVEPTVPLRTRDDLSMAYTPGVGRVSLALAEHPEDVSRLTIKGNSVAVVTDGSAVLGLGNIGPGAALPVMEGKAALFKRFADIDAWPICLDTHDTDEIVRAVELIAPGFGGINLEDIAAPQCFEIEARLRESLDIPVFHDDQHGTAIVVLAALTNALRCVGKELPDARVVVAGAGAAGSAIVSLLLAAGAHDIIVWDKEGLLSGDDTDLPPAKLSLAQKTNPRKLTGTLRDGLQDADVFIGVSAGGVLDPEWIEEMAKQQIVFALANPDPEVDIAEASRRAAVVASGRSDYPNQINNVLAFPGVFRGLLDARAKHVTVEMLLRAAYAIAGVVTDEQLNPNYIIPSVFDSGVATAVATAIAGPEEKK
ncbi:NAD-dependent malic enzyme [Epidermidibacterium keratini]|uniref:NAD-dependent malic enzyme n=1 Tax=Epidermidibacterium keratini TaxID=1891644 RepID=A0A7L4YNU6_9ACTN|nr:NAD-dependent malic enzyme [Epidermidibacterium keratini]QHC00748.1 NAD-dependent malic enzyme [Epidermidibacterium keratini]